MDKARWHVMPFFRIVPFISLQYISEMNHMPCKVTHCIRVFSYKNNQLVAGHWLHFRCLVC